MIDQDPALDPEAPARAARMIRQRIGARRPRFALVLGSGLGFLADEVQDPVRIPYRDIPGFPEPTVEGHAGELLAGRLAGQELVVQSGRFHMYEGHSAAQAGLPVRVFAELGVEIIVLTNAAGGVRKTFGPGTLMLVSDLVNLTFRSPLLGSRFHSETIRPARREFFDPGVLALARAAARQARIRLDEGVYAGLLGPCYETPAEVRMLDRMGVDAVGMSTVPEVLVARARGLRCVAISTITNAAAGLSATRLSHAEVMKVAESAKGGLAAVVRGIIAGEER